MSPILREMSALGLEKFAEKVGMANDVITEICNHIYAGSGAKLTLGQHKRLVGAAETIVVVAKEFGPQTADGLVKIAKLMAIANDRLRRQSEAIAAQTDALLKEAEELAEWAFNEGREVSRELSDNFHHTLGALMAFQTFALEGLRLLRLIEARLAEQGDHVGQLSYLVAELGEGR